MTEDATSAAMPVDAEGPLLQIRGLRKAFGTKVVLDGVDLAIPAGQVTTVVGKSGAGKSVLLKCIAGLLEPDSGEILVAGSAPSLVDRTTGERRVSYMFQNNALFDHLTAAENVALPLIESSSLPRRTIFQRVARLLERLEVGEGARRYPAELSGGMQKRVALARTLITNPQLVLFDEPTAGLDPVRKNSVLQMIERYRRAFGFTALIVSHDLPETLYVTDTVAVLDGGRVSFVGPPVGLEAEDNRLGAFLTRSEEQLRLSLLGAGNWGDFLREVPAACADATHLLALSLRRLRAIGTADRFSSFEVMRSLLAICGGADWRCGRCYLPDGRSLVAAVRAPDGPEALKRRILDAVVAADLSATTEDQAFFTVEYALHPLGATAHCGEGVQALYRGASRLFAARLPGVPVPSQP